MCAPDPRDAQARGSGGLNNGAGARCADGTVRTLASRCPSPLPPDLASRLRFTLPPAADTLPLTLWAQLSGKTLVVQVPLPPGVSLSVAFANKPLFFLKAFSCLFLLLRPPRLPLPVPPTPLFLSPRSRPFPSRASAPRQRCRKQPPRPRGGRWGLWLEPTRLPQWFSSGQVATSGDGFDLHKCGRDAVGR